MSGAPSAEIAIDAALVRGLLEEQHPDLAALPIAAAGAGWDNAMFRLGDALAVRLPRRAMSAPLILYEQRWLPEIAPRLPLLAPAPLRVGVAGCGYPWAWSVLPWLPGTRAVDAPPRADQGAVLAAFLRALHQPAPAEAPHNPYRGVPLAQRVAAFEPRAAFVAARSRLITPLVSGLWQEGLAAPQTDARVWLHGDLHPRNVLVDEAGALCGVIDWGDICGGDPAGDLYALWFLLPDKAARAAAIAAYGADDATWARARGWTVLQAVTFLEAGLVNDAELAGMGASALARLAEDL